MAKRKVGLEKRKKKNRAPKRKNIVPESAWDILLTSKYVEFEKNKPGIKLPVFKKDVDNNHVNIGEKIICLYDPGVSFTVKKINSDNVEVYDDEGRERQMYTKTIISHNKLFELEGFKNKRKASKEINKHCTLGIGTYYIIRYKNKSSRKMSGRFIYDGTGRLMIEEKFKSIKDIKTKLKIEKITKRNIPNDLINREDISDKKEHVVDIARFDVYHE